MTGDRRRLLHLTTSDMSLALLLGPQLEAFAAAGYEVIAASAPGPHRAEIEALGVQFVPVEHATRSMDVGQDLRAMVEVGRLFRRLRPDIVHTHNPKPGLYGRLAAKATRVPVVINTVHGLYAAPDDRLAKRRLVHGLERIAATCSQAELLQNPEDLETLAAAGVPRHKLHLLGNGIDLARFDPHALAPSEVARVRAELADDAEVVCGVVGRLVWEKGLQEIFEAARRLRRTHPQLRVVVVGPADPAKADELRPADLARATAQSGIHFAGERRDMGLVHAAFDIFALASHREGFPRAAMEASAMGVPVVATDIRGCRQVVDDGVTGTLVPVRDPGALAQAVADLVDDPGRRHRYGEAARRRARVHFDQQRVIDTTLTTYERLLASKRRH